MKLVHWLVQIFCLCFYQLGATDEQQTFFIS